MLGLLVFTGKSSHDVGQSYCDGLFDGRFSFLQIPTSLRSFHRWARLDLLEDVRHGNLTY